MEEDRVVIELNLIVKWTRSGGCPLNCRVALATLYWTENEKSTQTLLCREFGGDIEGPSLSFLIECNHLVSELGAVMRDGPENPEWRLGVDIDTVGSGGSR